MPAYHGHNIVSCRISSTMVERNQQVNIAYTLYIFSIKLIYVVVSRPTKSSKIDKAPPDWTDPADISLLIGDRSVTGCMCTLQL